MTPTSRREHAATDLSDEREDPVVDECIVAGSFTVTIGSGAGPRVVMVVSTQNRDGTPNALSLPKVGTPRDTWPIRFYTALSAMFGTSSFECEVTRIQDIYPPPKGYISVELELVHKGELGGSLTGIGPTAFAVVVEDGSVQGQAVVTGSGVLQPQTWLPSKESDPPER